MPPLKIVVGTNSLTSARHQAYSNHCQLWFRFGRDYPHTFIFVNPDRMSIDRMRNMCAETALYNEADYILFLDDDVIVPKDCLSKLLAADADIVAGDVFIRGYPFNHMLFRYTDEEKLSLLPLREVEEGLIDVDAVGFSLCLIKVSLLKKLARPYFVTGLTNTEDIYFCYKASKAYPEVIIKADTTIKCAHILWDEVISPYNVDDYRKYYEAQNPEVLEEGLRQDRGEKYLKEALAGVPE